MRTVASHHVAIRRVREIGRSGCRERGNDAAVAATDPRTKAGPLMQFARLRSDAVVRAAPKRISGREAFDVMRLAPRLVDAWCVAFGRTSSVSRTGAVEAATVGGPWGGPRSGHPALRGEECSLAATRRGVSEDR